MLEGFVHQQHCNTWKSVQKLFAKADLPPMNGNSNEISLCKLYFSDKNKDGYRGCRWEMDALTEKEQMSWCKSTGMNIQRVLGDS